MGKGPDARTQDPLHLIATRPSAKAAAPNAGALTTSIANNALGFRARVPGLRGPRRRGDSRLSGSTQRPPRSAPSRGRTRTPGTRVIPHPFRARARRAIDSDLEGCGQQGLCRVVPFTRVKRSPSGRLDDRRRGGGPRSRAGARAPRGARPAPARRQPRGRRPISFGMFASFFFTALYMQNILGFSPLETGV